MHSTMIAQGTEKSHPQTDRWAAFEKFETEYSTQSHRRIAAAWNDELFSAFQPAEKYRADVAVANRCVQTLDRLVAEYRRQHWQAVIDIYESWREHFDTCTDYLEGFKNHVEEARKQIALKYKQRLQRALDLDDDEELERIVSQEAVGYNPRAVLDYFERLQVLTREEREQATRALERLKTIREITKYLGDMNAQDKALALYDEKADELQLADSTTLTRQDRMALYEARRAKTRDALRHALLSRDDNQILAAASAALASGWTLRDATLDLVRDAGERKAARDRVAQAGNAQELLIAYDDEVLNEDKQFAGDKRETIQSARRVLKPLLALKRAIKRNDVRTIATMAAAPAQLQELVTHLDSSEKDVLARMQTAIQTMHSLRKALSIQPRTEQTLKQIVNLTSMADQARPLELLMTPYEKEEVRKALATFAAVDELSRLENAPDMPYIKLAIAKTYHTAYQAGVVLPNSLNWTKIRGALEFAERWSALTRALEAGDERAIFRAWNPAHLHDALELLTERDRQVLKNALQNISRRERLRSAIASNDEQRITYAKGEMQNLSET